MWFNVILASGSPRRKELLERMGLEFDILVTDANEDVKEGWSPTDTVLELAKRKAKEAVKICQPDVRRNLIILAADTIVYKDGRILGKPKDKKEAFDTLKMLNGDWHSVYTGLAVAFVDGKPKDGSIDKVEYVQDVCHTRVKFKSLSDKQIEEYVNTGEPFDKAGAYGIQGQGGRLVEKIEGDYDNVVGLPTELLSEILKSKGWATPN